MTSRVTLLQIRAGLTREQIQPYLEYVGSGISSLWARTLSLKHNCHVVVGYPEKVDVSHKWPTSPEYYNSAIIVNNEGETIGNYRKHFLFMIDETWALEGNGFGKDYIPGLGQTAMGICKQSSLLLAFDCIADIDSKAWTSTLISSRLLGTPSSLLSTSWK